MDYNNFITKWRENNKEEIKKRLEGEKPPEIVSSTEPIPEDKNKKGSI